MKSEVINAATWMPFRCAAQRKPTSRIGSVFIAVTEHRLEIDQSDLEAANPMDFHRHSRTPTLSRKFP